MQKSVISRTDIEVKARPIFPKGCDIYDDIQEGVYDDLVRKDVSGNLRYRKNVADLCLENDDYAALVWNMCKEDIVYFINLSVWTYDPRQNIKERPFITWDYEDLALRYMASHVGVSDVAISKSRDMGATWMMLLVYIWRFIFYEDYSFLIVSRTADLVDKTGNPKSLFWKVDFVLERLPYFLKPDYVRNGFHLYNTETGSIIDGESTTADIARGDRRTSIFIDEFAAFPPTVGFDVLRATADATNSRFFNSTPKGANTAYSRIKATCKNLIQLHWSLHPEKNEGLSTDMSGKLTSPWYENECERRGDAREIAQELDIDETASDYQFFETKKISELSEEYVSPASRYYLDDDNVLCKDDDGAIHLWTVLDSNNNPPFAKYCAGVDVSVGTGSSNSVITIANIETGEKVLEYAVSTLRPDLFADDCVAICKIFHNALLAWESNGPGLNFGDRVIAGHNYFKVFYREAENTVNRRRNMNVAGWHSSADSKSAMLRDYRSMLYSKTFINHSANALNECLNYIYKSTGSIEHNSDISGLDPTGARANHGDRVIADGLCCKMVKGGAKMYNKKYQPIKAPIGSMAYRRMLAQQRMRERESKLGNNMRW